MPASELRFQKPPTWVGKASRLRGQLELAVISYLRRDGGADWDEEVVSEEAAGGGLDALNAAVQACGNGVGYAMFAMAEVAQQLEVVATTGRLGFGVFSDSQ